MKKSKLFLTDWRLWLMRNFNIPAIIPIIFVFIFIALAIFFLRRSDDNVSFTYNGMKAELLSSKTQGNKGSEAVSTDKGSG
jgi:hypothetical protein